MSDQTTPIMGTAADVPYVAVPPASADRATAPLVVTWHLMDPPRTPAAMASAVPLAGLEAWRVYLTLPLAGERMPAGGVDEIMRLGMEDAVLNLHGPIDIGGAEEFPAVLDALRAALSLDPAAPLALVGGSAGSAVVQAIVAEQALPVAAAVTISPVVRLRTLVEAIASEMGFTYPWSSESAAVADRLDFVARAAEIAQRHPHLPFRAIVGDADLPALVAEVHEQRAALDGAGVASFRADVQVIAGMPHALADEPGIAPAPQLPHAAEVDRLATEWLNAHLFR